MRAYTDWPAYAAFLDDVTGTIEQGRWADLTVLTIDPFVLGETDPAAILDGEVLMTIVAGKVAAEPSSGWSVSCSTTRHVQGQTLQSAARHCQKAADTHASQNPV